MTSCVVQMGTSVRPWTGGRDGCEPVARRTPCRARSTVSPTRTVRGPTSSPRPRRKRPPRAVNRSTPAESSHPPVTSARSPAATGAQSGVTSTRPTRPSARRASASRPAVRVRPLRGQAGPERALATDEALLDADDVDTGASQPQRGVLTAGAHPEDDDVAGQLRGRTCDGSARAAKPPVRTRRARGEPSRSADLRMRVRCRSTSRTRAGAGGSGSGPPRWCACSRPRPR